MEVKILAPNLLKPVNSVETSVGFLVSEHKAKL